MIRVSVLDPRERRRWRVYERNLVTVQVETLSDPQVDVGATTSVTATLC